MPSKDVKVAIVHDWFVGGGAERVVLELHKMYPEAPIYTSYCSEEWRQKLDGKVVTGFLQQWPFPALRKFVPFLRIWWFGQLKFEGYGLVISSSGAEAKGIKVKKPAIHINYCHAPTHYYWNRYDDYLKSPGFGIFDPLARLGLRLLVGPLRRWDYKAAQRPDYMIANSNFTKEQIKKYYRRDSRVIHPPVDVDRFKIRNKPAPHQNPSGAASNQVAERQVFGAGSSISRHGFLAAGRQTPYKKIELAVRACTQLGLPLTVIGDGPDHKRLVKLAGPSIKFLVGLSDKEVVKHFQSAEAFIFPGIDDFGIVAVEAMAAGTPVIAYKASGALDYVEEGKTGLFFDEQSAESLAKAISKFSPEKFDHAHIQKSATQFSAEVFKNRMNEFISKLLG